MPSGGSTKSASNTTDTAPFDELATATTASRRKVNPDYPGSSGVVAQLEARGLGPPRPSARYWFHRILRAGDAICDLRTSRSCTNYGDVSRCTDEIIEEDPRSLSSHSLDLD
jgi:hypothetical protein